MEDLLNQDKAIMLSALERGNIETMRNRVILRYETMQLEVFDPKDQGKDFDAVDPIIDDGSDNDHY